MTVLVKIDLGVWISIPNHCVALRFSHAKFHYQTVLPQQALLLPNDRDFRITSPLVGWQVVDFSVKFP